MGTRRYTGFSTPSALVCLLVVFLSAPVSRGQVVDVMASLLNNVTNLASSSSRQTKLSLVNSTVTSLDTLLNAAVSLDNQNKTTFMKSCFEALGKLQSLLAQSVLYDETITFEKTNLRLFAKRVNISQFNGWQSAEFGIDLPSQTLPTISPGTTVVISSYIIVPARSWIPRPVLINSTIASRITSVSVLGEDGSEIQISSSSSPIKFSFDHIGNENQEKITKCVTLMSDLSSWTTDMCDVGEDSPSKTVCHCSKPATVAVAVEEKNAVGIIAWFGCSVAALCELITVVILIGLKLMSTVRMYVHVSLIVALAAWQAIFLTGIRYTDVPAVCLMVAMVLHFLFLATFCCLLCLALYAATVAQRNRPREGFSFMHFVAISWGVPAMVVGISFILRYDNYRSHRYCWVTEYDYMDLAFFVPAAFIVLLNIMIVIYVIYAYRKFRKSIFKEQLQEIRIEVGACIVLLPVVSAGNVICIFVMNDSYLIYQALFSVFNVLQGITVLWFFLVKNAMVQKTWKKRFAAKVGTGPKDTKNYMIRNTGVNEKEEENLASNSKEDADAQTGSVSPRRKDYESNETEQPTADVVTDDTPSNGQSTVLPKNKIKPITDEKKETAEVELAVPVYSAKSTPEGGDQSLTSVAERSNSHGNRSTETQILELSTPNRDVDNEDAQLLSNDHTAMSAESASELHGAKTQDTGV